MIDGLGLTPQPCYYYSRVDCYRVVVGDDAPLAGPCIRDIQAGFDDGYDVEIVDEGNAQTPDWRRTDAADVVVVVVFPVAVNVERGTSQLRTCLDRTDKGAVQGEIERRFVVAATVALGFF